MCARWRDCGDRYFSLDVEIRGVWIGRGWISIGSGRVGRGRSVVARIVRATVAKASLHFRWYERETLTLPQPADAGSFKVVTPEDVLNKRRLTLNMATAAVPYPLVRRHIASFLVSTQSTNAKSPKSSHLVFALSLPASTPNGPNPPSKSQVRSGYLLVERNGGLCVAVLSGDTIVLIGKPRPDGKPPSERILSLAYVSAPRMKRDGDEVLEEANCHE